MVSFRPDGAGVRARVGLLTPHFDPVPETEIRVMLPQGVSLHVARAPLGMIDPGARIVTHFGRDAALSFANGPGLKSAAARLAPLDTAAAIYGFTGSSYAQTEAEEDALVGRLSEVLGDVPVILQARALVRALGALAASRVALIHPPWVRGEAVEYGGLYYRRHGFEVVDNGRADVARVLSEVGPEALYNWISARVPDDAEAVAVSSGSLRAIGTIEALEARLGRPVVTGNQAALWAALRAAGIGDRVEGYGRLFECAG
jgi:maleate isomerase